LSILKNSFGKEEKLCSEKDIDLLYKTGASFLSHPIVVYYLPKPELSFSKVLVSVSKKKFKRAVDRNLLKRRMREAYRLNKSILKAPFHFAFVFVGNDPVHYQLIEKALVSALKKISD
jgi:ribonuclease P protein component